MAGSVLGDDGRAPRSAFDGATGPTPWVDAFSGEIEWISLTGEPGGPFDGGGPGGELDDVEVVDGWGLPVLPPDHTEQELAAILATCPYADALTGPGGGVPIARGPGAAAGTVPDVPWQPLDVLDGLAPGVALAGTLNDLTGLESSGGHGRRAGGSGRAAGSGPAALEALADGELRRVVAEWERVVSWARAAQARVAAELMTRTDGPLGRDSVAGEVAAELRVTSGEGWQIAARGEGLDRYPDLAEALAGGKVDAKKADTFLRAGADLTLEERGEAITDLLPAAPERTWKWISEQMNARAATLHGRKARRREVVDRCNVWAEQAGPGMGRITADLPVVDAARTFNTIQAAAKALKDVPGETRPLGALRAAAFAALVTGDLVLPCPQEAEASAGESGPGTELDRGTGLDRDAEPDRLVEPVLDTDLIPVPADPHGVVLTGAKPRDAAGTQVRVVDVSATVHVTLPATMLLDPADMTPGVLDGIGPIPADVAARIATDATWRRLLTDPVTGILTDYSTRTYAPGATLRAAVSARDQTCRFPGCHRPATTGARTVLDLDHIHPFDHEHRYRPDEPGQTRADNLHPLCRKHHNLKTHANWLVTRDPDTGITRWTAPTGTTTVVEPAVTDPTIRYALAHGMTLAEPPTTTSGAADTPGNGDADPSSGPCRGAPPF